jgi:FixJ family two-component response regulator
MVELSPAQRQEQERLSRTPSVPNQLAQRARIVLRAAEGASNREIAAALGLSLPNVGQWRTAYARRARPGSPTGRAAGARRLDEQAAGLIVAKALERPAAQRAPAGSTSRRRG